MRTEYGGTCDVRLRVLRICPDMERSGYGTIANIQQNNKKKITMEHIRTKTLTD